ncbi:MAG: redoxin family protein [Fimbriiglobus sp.]|jgi:peroxiredoxin|nr:redoxin family protein [Fimbriiglobus sp.]
MPPRFIASLAAAGWLTTLALAADSTEAPKPQPAAHAGVGRLAPDLTATTVDGAAFKLSDALKGKKAGVVAVTSVTCPLSKKYLPTLAALEKEYAAKGVGFVVIDAVKTDKPEELKKLAANAGLTAALLHDADGTLCKHLGAASTTDVFVLDPARTVKYRGAIDDQYGLGYSKEAPKHTFARAALDAVLAGREPAIPATTAPGCALDLAEVKVPEAKPTYHNFASRLIQQNCQECHRTGGVGPFTLETLDDVKAHKGMVKKVVADGRMPVWNAFGDKPGEHRTFKNDRSLPAEDKARLLAWIADGCPEGDKADAPLARTFADGDWTIGKPDLVVQIPEPIKVSATGVMKYQNVIVDTKLTEEKWVTAAEIIPTARAVVHHVLVFALPPKKPGEIDLPQRGEGQGYYAAYVPGNSRQVLPEGFARKLPKGARIRFQIHYTPNGTATEDQVKVGFKFGPAPRHEVKVFPLTDPRISIPPGADNHAESVELRLPFDVVLTAFSPHMHVRGKAARYECDVTDPKTKQIETKVLLDVPQYDFNWQLRYELAEPVTLKAGSVIRYRAWYDNSDKNPANPDPAKRVKWGDQTFEEMFLGYAEYYRPQTVVKDDKK